MKLITFGATDPGRKRANNEDAYLLDDRLRLYAVADGVGGVEGGEVASRIAVETLGEAMPDLLGDRDRTPPAGRSSVCHSGRPVLAWLTGEYFKGAIAIANFEKSSAAEPDPAPGYGIAVDGTGNAHITGHTKSSDFPTTSGAYDTTYDTYAMAGDAFITKLDPTGSALTYSTFVGGYGTDSASGIVLDGSGNACVAGYPQALDYPTTSGAYDTSHNGSDDVFVTKINSSGTALLFSTFVGAGSLEYCYISPWTEAGRIGSSSRNHDTALAPRAFYSAGPYLSIDR